MSTGRGRRREGRRTVTDGDATRLQPRAAVSASWRAGHRDDSAVHAQDDSARPFVIAGSPAHQLEPNRAAIAGQLLRRILRRVIMPAVRKADDVHTSTLGRTVEKRLLEADGFDPEHLRASPRVWRRTHGGGASPHELGEERNQRRRCQREGAGRHVRAPSPPSWVRSVQRPLVGDEQTFLSGGRPSHTHRGAKSPH